MSVPFLCSRRFWCWSRWGYKCYGNFYCTNNNRVRQRLNREELEEEKELLKYAHGVLLIYVCRREGNGIRWIWGLVI